ncbi:hypothetical protein [Dictyobacter arantiisoli]|uniref:UDP-N-acetylglucosamine kinase n=1 Tax=Dictyobacter arantiisoli TaxID=2014874 RepID=A0A5A5T9T2_9CHLR|nr:hypothetical protein [Dictyobacter arantiisoli]GCF08270.1 hypothetical protein KDI_18340 [Dictyobacter arantiisoli]
MAMTLFLLGRPGSGKSTAAHYLHLLSQQQGWSTIHINDYPFLRSQFEADTQQIKFKPTGYGGFDVLDFSVLDTALHAIEYEARIYSAHPRKLVLLEFARDDYIQALQQFQCSFLRNAYFLFLNADLDTCVRRVHNRAYHPTTRNDHFISEAMLRSYYQQEYDPLLLYRLLSSYGIQEQHVRIINNTETHYKFQEQLENFLQEILARDQHSAGQSLSSYTAHPVSAIPYQQHATSCPIHEGQILLSEVEAPTSLTDVVQYE